MARAEAAQRGSAGRLWFRILVIAILSLTFLSQSTLHIWHHLIAGYPDLAWATAHRYLSDLLIIPAVLQGLGMTLLVALWVYTGCPGMGRRRWLYPVAGGGLSIVVMSAAGYIGSRTAAHWFGWAGLAVIPLASVVALVPFAWSAWRRCGPPWAAYKPNSGEQTTGSELPNRGATN